MRTIMSQPADDHEPTLEQLDALRRALLELRARPGPRAAEQEHLIRELLKHHIEALRPGRRKAA